MSTFLEDAVEDAIFSLSEQSFILPATIDIWYSEEEWVAVERFHRLRLRKDAKIGISNDRYPFIRLHILGINVNLFPEPKPIETIQ